MSRMSRAAAAAESADFDPVDKFAALLVDDRLPSRAALARRLRARGMTIRAIAGALSCGERYVYKLLGRDGAISSRGAA
ncbi:MAG TPA: hypothetical protein VNE82_24960 [Candidatus Binataceae bacterium]|nr:hypothetical protein [Candidatus Binataceae bacterium]